MSDDAFLRAIAAAPDDTAPRLVYADWLDERDDPRAEFIRLQTAMDALPVSGEEYAARRLRREALRAEIDPAWLAAMGYTLRHRPLFTKLPPTRQERWRLVEEFVSIWDRPLRPDDGYSEAELVETEGRLGFRLPAALREWYALAGRRNDIWSKQDHQGPLDRLTAGPSGALNFRWENQGNEHWVIRPEDSGQDDPPVFETYAAAVCSPTTTAFAVVVLLGEAKWGGNRICASTNVATAVAIQRLGQLLHKCDLPERYWVADPIHFFEGTDLVVDVQADEWIFVAARTEQAYTWLVEQTGWTFER